MTIKTELADVTGGTGNTIGEVLKSGLGGSGQTIAAAVASGASSVSVGNVDAFVVSFDANGGTGTQTPVACAEGSSVELPETTTFTKSGKTFAGWGTTAAATKAVESVSATEAMTLYAIWK